jgi:hypothetical protein
MKKNIIATMLIFTVNLSLVATTQTRNQTMKLRNGKTIFKESHLESQHSRYKKALPKPYNDLCPICYESLKNQRNVYISTCNHCFHRNCLASWFNTIKEEAFDPLSKKACPYCRQSVAQEAEERLYSYAQINDIAGVRETLKDKTISSFGIDESIHVAESKEIVLLLVHDKRVTSRGINEALLWFAEEDCTELLQIFLQRKEITCNGVENAFISAVGNGNAHAIATLRHDNRITSEIIILALMLYTEYNPEYSNTPVHKHLEATQELLSDERITRKVVEEILDHTNERTLEEFTTILQSWLDTHSEN